MRSADTPTVRVTVELFGRARTAAGIAEVDVHIPVQAGPADLAAALVAVLPALKGIAVAEDGSDMMPSYTANINGLQFMTDDQTTIRRGDRLFVFSSQAGG